MVQRVRRWSYLMPSLRNLLRRVRRGDLDDPYRGIFERIPVGLYRTSAAGKIIYANPALVELTGYPSREALLAAPPESLWVRPEDRDRWRALMHRDEVLRDFEFEHRRFDGTIFWARESSRLIRNSRGAVIAYEGTIADVTAEKRAEDAMRASEERLRLVARATNDVIWDWDVSTGRIVWSEAGPRAFRYPPEEVGTTVDWHYEHVHPDDQERVVSGSSGVISGTDEVWCDEYRFLRGDGSYATVLDRGYVVRNSRGEAVRVIGSMMDVTERKRQEETHRFLAQASTLLDASLDLDHTFANLARLAVPTIADYCMIDLVEEGGGIRRVAAAHRDPTKEVLLRADEYHPPDADPEQHPVVKAVRTGKSALATECTDAMLNAMGRDARQDIEQERLALCSFMVVPLIARGNTLGAIILVAGDSERRFQTTDITVAEDLAYRAALAISNARLYADAQRAIRARDEVLGVVSHDLRNPLHTIQLSTSLLLDMSEERRADNVRSLQVMRRATDQMNTLIEDLLDVSSIEAGRFSVSQAHHDAAALVTQACELLRPLADHNSIRLAAELAEELPRVWIDSKQVTRVFSNLIGNAIKFTPAEGTITVRAERDGAEVRFAVADTGAGIPPEQLPHVFDRFWQAQTGDRRGAGLGLAIARGIVQAHGGQMWAESKVGEGATFLFTLGVAQAETGT